METTPEFLKAQYRDQNDPPQWTQLACFVKNYTPGAISLTVPFYTLDHMPHMTAEEHRLLIARNADRVCAPLRVTQSEPISASIDPTLRAHAASARPPEPQPSDGSATEWR